MSLLSITPLLGSSRSQFTSRMAPCPSGPHVHVAWGQQSGAEDTIRDSNGVGGCSPHVTLSTSVLPTDPLRLVSASSEMSAGTGMLIGAGAAVTPRFRDKAAQLTHAGEVQHGSAHRHPAGLPKIGNPDLQHSRRAQRHPERGPDPPGWPAPTFSSPTSLLSASMVTSTSVLGARGQRPTLEGSFTLCVSCTT